MDNKVTVKIYGQEYTIAGDKTSDEIKSIAKYVDEKMHLMSRAFGDSAAGSVAILSSINIAEEYFDALALVENLKTSKTQLENDSKYYLKMWEDSKKNFMKYKEDIADVKLQKKASEDHVQELETKVSELESTFFDIQMENIQLKSELEKLKAKI